MPRRRRAEKPRRRKKPKEPEKASSKESPSPSVYLVVGHGVTSPAYSVIKAHPFAADAGHGGTATPIPPHLARLEAKHCMSFVPVRSRHGPWIVGVGGNRAADYAPETIVFDTKTEAVIPGPKLLSTKLYPVLLPLGDKIYALASTPAVKGDVNFVPWFEVLDLSQAQVEDGRLVGCEWKDLPRPPFFPWDLTPTQYIFPPEFEIKSHVAVAGSYILVSMAEGMMNMHGLSITAQQTGTHMFDVVKKQWAKLDDKGLPFIGGAIPHGPLLFLGFSSATRRLTAYKITVCSSTPSLSILELPISTGCDDAKGDKELLSTRRFVSLISNPADDNPGFCSFRCCSDDPPAAYIPELMWKDHTRELVTMTTCTTESQDCCLESTRSLVISNQWKQVYVVSDPLRRLTSPCLENIISF